MKIHLYSSSKTMLLGDIKVPRSFRESVPHIGKVVYANEFFLKYGFLDQPIIINHNGYLMDNYVRYLVAQSHSVQTVPVIQIKAKIVDKPATPKTIKLTLKQRLSGKCTVRV